MKIAIVRERNAREQRVSATPDSVKKFIKLGAELWVEHGAGEGSGIRDMDFEAAGARMGNLGECLGNSDIVLSVNRPEKEVLTALSKQSMLIGMLSPYEKETLQRDVAPAVNAAFSMEMLPRISRAQSMDVLSSQSNLAGYRAVIDAVAALGKAVPMMMTAAGTIAPAKVLVLGAGVAGLQAIATAKRLGAVVSAFDVRPVAKEQVESLGAKFIEVTSEESKGAETAGGYAKEMSEDYKKKQSALIHQTLKTQDIAIATALIPGRPAPVLITETMVKDMKEGAVIVDLAVAAGGNCPLARPNEIVKAHGVTILGHTNMPSRVAADASALYARNLYNFVSALMIKDGTLAVQWDDELIKGTLVTKEGALTQ